MGLLVFWRVQIPRSVKPSTLLRVLTVARLRRLSAQRGCRRRPRGRWLSSPDGLAGRRAGSGGTSMRSFAEAPGLGNRVPSRAPAAGSVGPRAFRRPKRLPRLPTSGLCCLGMLFLLGFHRFCGVGDAKTALGYQELSGSGIRFVLDNCLGVVPEAASLRTHGLVQSFRFLPVHIG